MEPIESLSFEAAMAELETLTWKLEQGQIPLAEALALYDRVKALFGLHGGPLSPTSGIELIDVAKAGGKNRVNRLHSYHRGPRTDGATLPFSL